MYYHLYLSLKRKNKTGNSPVYIKITIAGKKYERTTGIWIQNEHWSKVFKRVHPGNPNHLELNKRLNKIEELLSTPLASIEQIDDALNNSTKNSQKPTLKMLLNDYIAKLGDRVGLPADRNGVLQSTYNNYLNRKKNIDNWLNDTNQTNLVIEAFNEGKMHDFIDYMTRKNKFKINYVNNHLKLIKRLMRYSHYTYSTNMNSFYFSPIKHAPRPKVYLLENELARIEAANFENITYNKVKDLFLMQCYTGMSYCDLVSVDFKVINIESGIEFIEYKRKKTNNTGLLPVLRKCKLLLLKYDYNLPILTNQFYNRMLKEIAAVVGINKHLTSHVGRKTFATLLLNRGASIETTAKMLGKTDIKDTIKTYADVLHSKIINEIPEIRQLSLIS